MEECGARDGAICPICLNGPSDSVIKARFEVFVCCWDEINFSYVVSFPEHLIALSTSALMISLPAWLSGS